MRIVGGAWRGRILKTPRGQAIIRPTSDRVRESLMNILGQTVLDRPFVDLCAGTGAVVLEALSRGASKGWAVENNRISKELIEKNADLLGAKDRLHILFMDISQALAQNPFPPESLFFLDPPYREEKVISWVKQIQQMVSPAISGGVILEHSRHQKMEEVPFPWGPGRIYAYGNTVLRVWRNE